MERKKLTRDEVYKSIKDRNAYILFNNLKVELFSAQLDGTNTHKSKNLLGVLNSIVNLYHKWDFPQEETIAEYKTRDKEMFNSSINTILEVVNNYNIKI